MLVQPLAPFESGGSLAISDDNSLLKVTTGEEEYCIDPFYTGETASQTRIAVPAGSTFQELVSIQDSSKRYVIARLDLTYDEISNEQLDLIDTGHTCTFAQDVAGESSSSDTAPKLLFTLFHTLAKTEDNRSVMAVIESADPREIKNG